MGITELPRPAFLDALERVFHFKAPREHGLDVVGAIDAMLAGKGKVFIGMGGNFLRATPDTPIVDDALRKCALTVQISTKLNHSHLACGKDALILPCLGRTERDVQATGPQQVTVEDSMSQVHASSGKNPPASEFLLSEPAIVAGIAIAALPASSSIDWAAMVADYSRIRDAIAKVMPELFHDYNNRIKKPGGFYLGNSAAALDWKTGTGKANFVTAPIPNMTLPAGQLRMMTIRSHDQFNTTVYDNNDRYRGIFGTRRVILMSPEDIATRGLSDGDFVDITSHSLDDQQTRHAANWRVVEYDIPIGCAATYFPEANVLISRKSFAEKSRTPVSKFVPITVAKVNR
jgi:molybdopterin-dependent oxidoreductase alpha subunit